MKLYVMRHGQTNWNILKKIQGKTDIELNENGIKQAQEAKAEFNKYNIELILCSPLKRAKKTAEIVNEDKKVPIILEEKITERGFGEMEGECPIDNEIFLANKFWNYNANSSSFSVEPLVDCCNKVWGFLDEIKEKYCDKNVLLVTHGGTAKVINGYFNGIGENGEMLNAHFENCEIREYKF